MSAHEKIREENSIKMQRIREELIPESYCSGDRVICMDHRINSLYDFIYIQYFFQMLHTFLYNLEYADLEEIGALKHRVILF